MKLSIIIVNFNTPELVLQCLYSIGNSTTVQYEIIIVDNDSKDNSKDIILNEFPNILWIQMGYNSGFSRANNAGIKASSGEYILLLNSDTIVNTPAIDVAIFNMDTDKSIVASSVQLLNADMSFQNAGNYFVRGGLNILLTLPVINEIFRTIGKLIGIRKPSVTTSDTVNYVDWISGAFMLVRKSVIKQSGFMDEDFFLFAEEIEWCGRLRRFGKIAVYPNVSVIHLEGGTTNKMHNSIPKSYYEYWTPKGFQLMVSNLLRIRKQYGVLWMMMIYIFYLIEIPVLFLAFLFSGKYTFLFLKDYIANVLSLSSLMPKIILNKPGFYKVI